LLLVWLLVALTFNSFYKPARQGQKVAYLTLASFVFLGIVFVILFFVPSSHGSTRGIEQVSWLFQDALITAEGGGGEA
jgi:hypothetical protein